MHNMCMCCHERVFVTHKTQAITRLCVVERGKKRKYPLHTLVTRVLAPYFHSPPHLSFPPSNQSSSWTDTRNGHQRQFARTVLLSLSLSRSHSLITHIQHSHTHTWLLSANEIIASFPFLFSSFPPAGQVRKVTLAHTLSLSLSLSLSVSPTLFSLSLTSCNYSTRRLSP